MLYQFVSRTGFVATYSLLEQNTFAILGSRTLKFSSIPEAYEGYSVTGIEGKYYGAESFGDYRVEEYDLDTQAKLRESVSLPPNRGTSLDSNKDYLLLTVASSGLTWIHLFDRKTLTLIKTAPFASTAGNTNSYSVLNGNNFHRFITRQLQPNIMYTGSGTIADLIADNKLPNMYEWHYSAAFTSGLTYASGASTLNGYIYMLEWDTRPTRYMLSKYDVNTLAQISPPFMESSKLDIGGIVTIKE